MRKGWMSSVGGSKDIAADPDETAGDVLNANPAGHWISEVLAASSILDHVAIRRELELAGEALGIAACIDDVVMPVLRTIGTWWSEGQYRIEQEAMTTEAVRSWFDQLSAFAPQPLWPDPILLSCGPHDRHTIGLEALALLLRLEGFSCRVMGGRMASNNLATAAKAHAAAAVVVVSHMMIGRQRALLSIEAVHGLGIKVFYAGESFSSSSSRDSVAGQYLGSQLANACSMIVSELRADS